MVTLGTRKASIVMFLLSISVISTTATFPKYRYISDGLITNPLPGNDAQGGSIYGISIKMNGKHVIIADPDASPNNLTNAGAVSYYKRNSFGALEQSQDHFIGSNSYNMISGTLLGNDGDDKWLFIPAFGTPLDVSDPSLKDNSGAFIVQKYHAGSYQTVQTVYNPDCPTSDKSACAYAFFGYNMAYDSGILIVGGAGVSAIYEYRETGNSTAPWQLHRRIVPDGFGSNPGISLAVLDVNRHGNNFEGVMLVQQPIFSFSPPNPIVFAFKLVNNEWVQTQNITYAPACNTTVNNLFASTISIDNEWAIITTPADCTAGNLTGSANFYKINRSTGIFTQKQTVVSSSPTFLFGFASKIYADTAFIGDPGRTVNGILYQGAIQAYELCDNDTWIATQLLTDVGAPSFNQLGAGGLEYDGTYLMASSDRIAAANIPYLPSFVPPTGFPPSGPSRVRTWIKTYN